MIAEIAQVRESTLDTFNHQSITLHFLHHLTLSRFRTFVNGQLIGPFLGFTAIIGANGSGKSSVVQAVLYVLGAVEIIGQPRIQLFIQTNNGLLALARQYTVYQIGKHRISQAEYRRFVLNRIGPLQLLVATQGSVDLLATKSAKSLSLLLDQLSGSKALAEPFQSAKLKQKGLAVQLKNFLKLQVQLKEEKKSLKLLADSSEKYRLLVEQLEQVQIQMDQAEACQIKGKLEHLRVKSDTEGQGKIVELEQQIDHINSQCKKFQTQQKKNVTAIKKYNQQRYLHEKQRQSVELQIRSLDKALERQMAQRAHHMPYVEKLIQRRSQLSTNAESIKFGEQVDPQFVRLSIRLEQKCGQTLARIRELQMQKTSCLCSLQSVHNQLNTLKTKNQRILSLQQSHKVQVHTLVLEKEQLLTELIGIPPIDPPSQQACENRLQELRQQVAELREKIEGNNRFQRVRDLEGVLGKVEDLLKISAKGYQHLKRTVLGKFADVICVRGEGEVQRIKRLGYEQLTLLVLDNLRRVQSSFRTREIDGLGVPAEHILIAEDNSLAELVRIVARGKVICKNFGQGDKLRKMRIKGVAQIITADGHVFKQNGIIVSHATRKQCKDSYARLNELVKQLGKQEQRVQRLHSDQQFQKKQKQYLDRQNRRKQLTNKLQVIEEHLKQAPPGKQLQSLGPTQRAIQNEEGRLQRLKQLIAKENSSIRSLEQEIFREYCSERGGIDPSQLRQKFNSEFVRREVSRKQAARQQLQSIERQIHRVNLRGIDQKIQRLTTARQTLERSLPQLGQPPQKKDFVKLIAKARERRVKLETQLAGLRDRRGMTAQTEMAHLKNRLKQLVELGRCKGLIQLEDGDPKFIKEPKQYSVQELRRRRKEKEEEVEEYEGLSAGLMGNNSARLRRVEARLEEVQAGLERVIAQHRQASGTFDILREKRKQLYMGLFRKVEKALSAIYSQVTFDEGLKISGTALLCLENQSLPFQAGLIYSPTPPTKKFVFDSATQLSGGEKAIASLCLLAALARATNLRTLILDEPDAFLDRLNVGRLVKLIGLLREEGRQVLVVSHKEQLFGAAESLVGVQRLDGKSSAVSMDLRNS